MATSTVLCCLTVVVYILICLVFKSHLTAARDSNRYFSLLYVRVFLKWQCFFQKIIQMQLQLSNAYNKKKTSNFLYDKQSLVYSCSSQTFYRNHLNQSFKIDFYFIFVKAPFSRFLLFCAIETIRTKEHPKTVSRLRVSLTDTLLLLTPGNTTSSID